jgi:hypothetical protein
VRAVAVESRTFDDQAALHAEALEAAANGAGSRAVADAIDLDATKYL